MRCRLCNGLHDSKTSCVKEGETVVHPAQFPAAPHWAIIIFDDLAHDDGYGGTSRHDYGKYQAFFSEDAWKAKITELSLPAQYYGSQKKFVAFKASGRASIKPSFNVSVEDAPL